MLTEAWSPNIKLQIEGVVIPKVMLRLKQINPIKPIVAPTFTHLKFRLKLSGNFTIGVSLAYHFHSILVFLRISWNTLLHLEEYWDVVTLCIVAIPIGIDFKSPSNPIRHKRLTVNRIFWMSMVRKVLQVVRCRHEVGNKVWSELSRHIIHKLKCWSIVNFL